MLSARYARASHDTRNILSPSLINEEAARLRFDEGTVSAAGS
jgi:hypothetical protein